MITDKYGQIILTEKDICNLYLKDTTRTFKKTIIEDDIYFHEDLEIENIPEFIKNFELTLTLKDFDDINQNDYKMPKEYHELDIAKYVLDQCTSDIELQRVGEELLLYVERDLLKLLQYLKYLVDTMRKYNVVWGVGRGSSVSSYVLYLIGVHKINSIFYDLDINEFLR